MKRLIGGMKRGLIALFILLASVISLAQDKPVAGPFGFERGMTREQVTKLVGKGTPSTQNPNIVFTFTSAPTPNPAFEQYNLFFSPTEGLLKVIAVGVTISTSDTGTELRSGFTTVVSGVSQKYGQPENTFDTCNGGAGCSSESVWMLGLLEKNRTLSAYWKSAHPSNSVRLISLDAKPLGLNSGYLILAYEFTGWEAFVDEFKAKQNTSY